MPLEFILVRLPLLEDLFREKKYDTGEIKYKISVYDFPFGVAFHTYGVPTQNLTG